MSRARLLDEAGTALYQAPDPGASDKDDLDGLPGPVQRYLRAAIAPKAPGPRGSPGSSPASSAASTVP